MKTGFYLFKPTGAIFHWNGKIVEIVSHTTDFKWVKVTAWIEDFERGNLRKEFIFLGE